MITRPPSDPHVKAGARGPAEGADDRPVGDAAAVVDARQPVDGGPRPTVRPARQRKGAAATSATAAPGGRRGRQDDRRDHRGDEAVTAPTPGGRAADKEPRVERVQARLTTGTSNVVTDATKSCRRGDLNPHAR